MKTNLKSINNLLYSYKNGNADITIYRDGTRIIDYPDNENIKLDFPLNIDIRVSTKCSMGFNPKTRKAICSFCHESASVDGKECDYDVLLQKLKSANLPKGIELAIGANAVTENLMSFLERAYKEGYICSITVNQAHVKKYSDKIKFLIENDFIKGLGISFRENLKFDIPDFIISYRNTVFHVIAGIDKWENIYSFLPSKGVKNILILGEKDFGFNRYKVKLDSPLHKEFYDNLKKLLNSGIYNIISFDNLALKQLDVKRFISDEKWKKFYQGEHSMYINAVSGYFSDSSRSFNIIDWNKTNLINFFKHEKIDNRETE